MLNGKNILIGITGGIAAYKICDLIRRFKKNGANVKVTATPNALNFVTKLTIGLGSVLMVNSFLLASLSTHKYAKEETTIKEYLKNKSKSSEQGKKDIEDKSNDNVLDNSKENTKN